MTDLDVNAILRGSLYLEVPPPYLSVPPGSCSLAFCRLEALRYLFDGRVVSTAVPIQLDTASDEIASLGIIQHV